MRHSFLILGATALALAGCATHDPREDFAPVQREVAALSGDRVEWDRSPDAERLVDDRVWRRLKSPLDADAAAQIALLNNPDLQATFEAIAISEAEPLQAGNMAATQARVAHEVIELIAQVKTAFYTYQADLALTAQLRSILQADPSGDDAAKPRQLPATSPDKPGLLQQQAQAAGTEMAMLEARKDMIAAREKLNRLMGLSSAAIVWSARPDLPPLPASDPGTAPLEELALLQRTDLLALREETDAVGKELALKTHTRYLPVIEGGADSERAPQQRGTGPRATFDIPAFDQSQGPIARLASEHRRLQQRLRSLTIAIGSEVREAGRTLVIDRQQVEFFRKSILPLNLEWLSQAQLQENSAAGKSNDLFLARQRELDGERDYVTAWRDYWISRAQLEAAAGGSLYPSRP